MRVTQRIDMADMVQRRLKQQKNASWSRFARMNASHESAPSDGGSHQHQKHSQWLQRPSSIQSALRGHKLSRTPVNNYSSTRVAGLIPGEKRQAQDHQPVPEPLNANIKVIKLKPCVSQADTRIPFADATQRTTSPAPPGRPKTSLMPRTKSSGQKENAIDRTAHVHRRDGNKAAGLPHKSQSSRQLRRSNTFYSRNAAGLRPASTTGRIPSNKAANVHNERS